MQIHKKITNSKLQRLEQIYDKLVKTKKGLSIKELAQDLSVSTKTIKRDLQGPLADMGLIKKGRLYKIDLNFIQDDLEQNEKIILNILDSLAKSAGNNFYNKAHTLLSKISQQIDNLIFANLNSETLNEENMQNFHTLEQAIKNKNIINFKYKNKVFNTKPLKLAFFDGFWYLLAFDIKEKEIFKKFYLKDINDININDETFQTDKQLEQRLQNTNSIWFNLNTPFEVKLLIEKPIRKYFERKPLNSQIITGEDKDGSIEIQIQITHEMEILPLIYYYMPYIKVLKPQFIADMVKENVKSYLQQIS